MYWLYNNTTYSIFPNVRSEYFMFRRKITNHKISWNLRVSSPRRILLYERCVIMQITVGDYFRFFSRVFIRCGHDTNNRKSNIFESRNDNSNNDPVRIKNISSVVWSTTLFGRECKSMRSIRKRVTNTNKKWIVFNVVTPVENGKVQLY